MNVKPHLTPMEPVRFVPRLLDSKRSAIKTGETTTRSSLASVRKIPFATPQQEAAAIDAKVALWQVRVTYCAIPLRTAEMAQMISDGMKAAAQLRISTQ